MGRSFLAGELEVRMAKGKSLVVGLRREAKKVQKRIVLKGK